MGECVVRSSALTMGRARGQTKGRAMRVCTLLQRAALAALVLALPASCQLVAGLRDIEEVDADAGAGADTGAVEVGTDTTRESSTPGRDAGGRSAGWALRRRLRG